MRAISARTRVLPDPAGALITDTSRPSARAASAAAAWSSRSPLRRVLGLAPGARRARVRSARLRAARGRRRARARLARVPCAARRSRRPGRSSGFPWRAGRGWRSGCRRGAGRCCGRRRGASWPGPRRVRGLPGTGRARTRSAGRGRPGPRAGAAASAGSRPVRGRTRPRYLITSARVQADFSCCASATAFCAARASSSCAGTRPGSCGPRGLRACAAAGAGVPDRRRDRGQAHAEGARELVRPARVQLGHVERRGLGGAGLEVGGLRELREFALGRRAAVRLLEPRGAGAQVRGDGLAAGGEQAHHLAGDALDLEAVAVVAGGPLQAEPGREGFLEVLGDDRGDRADVLVVAQGIRRPPLPVSSWSWRYGRSGSGHAAACRRRGRCAAASAPPPGRPRATGRSRGRGLACRGSRCGCSRPRFWK